MRVILCDKCGKELTHMHGQFGTVLLDRTRLDLCYAGCYQGYERVQRDEGQLADRMLQELVAQRKILWDDFKNSLPRTEGLDAGEKANPAR